MSNITIAQSQADRLWVSSMAFSASWREQEGRFETYGGVASAFDGIDGGWTFYWCRHASDQVLLEAFFVSEGIQARPLWDLAYAMSNLESDYDQDPAYVVLAQVPWEV